MGLSSLFLIVFSIFPITNTLWEENTPKVFPYYDKYFVVWVEYFSNHNIRGAIIDTNSDVHYYRNFPLLASSLEQRKPDIANFNDTLAIMTVWDQNWVYDPFVPNPYPGEAVSVGIMRGEQMPEGFSSYFLFAAYASMFEYEEYYFPKVAVKDDYALVVCRTFYFDDMSPVVIDAIVGNFIDTLGNPVWEWGFVVSELTSLNGKPEVTQWDGGFLCIYTQRSLDYAEDSLILAYLESPTDTVPERYHLIKWNLNYPDTITDRDLVYGNGVFVYAEEDVSEEEIKIVTFSYPNILIDTFRIEEAANPSIVYCLNKFYVFYNTTSGQIHAIRIDTTGHLMDPKDIPVITNNEFKREPHCFFDGEKFFLVFAQNGDIYGAFVDTTLIPDVGERGYPKGPEGVRIFPTVTKGNINVLMNLERDVGFHIYLSTVSGRRFTLYRDKGNPGYNLIHLKIPESLPSGIYFLSLKMKNYTLTERILYLK
jgi:hypothetical protein